MSFGLDSAVKTFSTLISDADCALQTQPDAALIGVEIQAENLLPYDMTQRENHAYPCTSSEMRQPAETE